MESNEPRTILHGDKPTRLTMIFGSDSDQDKILPGIKSFTTERPDVEVRVVYASADNTPAKVTHIANNLAKGHNLQGVLMSGAGMANVLTGVVKTHGDIGDLIIGVPIEDSITLGLSSIFSTGEKPPRNPVLTMPLNGTYAAAHIAIRFLEGSYEEVSIPNTADRDAIVKIGEQLQKYGIPFAVRSIDDINPDALVVTPFNISDDMHFQEVVKPLDDILQAGKGIQVGIKNEHRFSGYAFEDYIDYFKAQLGVTGFVTAGGYINAAIVAAQIMRHGDALDKIKGEKDTKKKKLKAHPGLLVVNGEAKPYDGS